MRFARCAYTQIIEQVRTLLKELCTAFNVPVPLDALAKLDMPLQMIRGAPASSTCPPTENSTDSGYIYINDDNDNHQRGSDTEDESDMDDEDDVPIDMEEDPPADKAKDDGLSREHTATLERLKQSQRDSYLKGAVSGSVQGK